MGDSCSTAVPFLGGASGQRTAAANRIPQQGRRSGRPAQLTPAALWSIVARAALRPFTRAQDRPGTGERAATDIGPYPAGSAQGQDAEPAESRGWTTAP